jgi:3-oxoacyl-[acyl-carrier protein] reductase
MVKQKYGRIINISSVVGLMGNIGQANYASTKSALIGFVKSLAKEYGRKNILINNVAPGFIETDMTAKIPEKLKEEILNKIPLRRYGKPEEVANLVAFLASDLNTYITGQTILIDGGLY